MVGGGDENQVAASYQYLTAGARKIFPEYPAFGEKTYLLIAGFRFLGISNRGAEAGHLAARRAAVERLPSRMGTKALRAVAISSGRLSRHWRRIQPELWQTAFWTAWRSARNFSR
jgi:hypothetical protein